MKTQHKAFLVQHRARGPKAGLAGLFILCACAPHHTQPPGVKDLGDLGLSAIRVGEMIVDPAYLRASIYTGPCSALGLIRSATVLVNLSGDGNNALDPEGEGLDDIFPGIAMHYSLKTKRYLITEGTRQALYPPATCESEQWMGQSDAQSSLATKLKRVIRPKEDREDKAVDYLSVKISGRLRAGQSRDWGAGMAPSTAPRLHVLSEQGNLHRLACAATLVDLPVAGFPTVAVTAASCIKKWMSGSNPSQLRIGVGRLETTGTVSIHLTLVNKSFWGWWAPNKTILATHDMAVLLSKDSIAIPRGTRARIANTMPDPDDVRSKLQIFGYGKPNTGFAQHWRPYDVRAHLAGHWEVAGVGAEVRPGDEGGGALLGNQLLGVATGQRATLTRGALATVGANREFLDCVSEAAPEFASTASGDLIADRCPSSRAPNDVRPQAQGTLHRSLFGRDAYLSSTPGHCQSTTKGRVDIQQVSVRFEDVETQQQVMGYLDVVIGQGAGQPVGVHVQSGPRPSVRCPDELPTCDETEDESRIDCACQSPTYDIAAKRLAPRLRHHFQLDDEYTDDEITLYQALLTLQPPGGQ